MTLAEKLTEVGNNRPKLYKKGALDYSPQETISGEAIGITDISPIEHNMAVSVRGKNLFNANGVVLGSLNSDGSFAPHASRGVSEYAWLKKGTYIFSKSANLTSYSKAYCYDIDKNMVKNLWNHKINTQVFTLAQDSYIRIAFDDALSDVQNAEIQIEEGTTSTKFAPYIADISTVKLLKQGKNLVSNDVYDINNWVNPSGNGYRYYFNLPVGTYTVSAEKKETVAYFYLQETTDDWVTAKSTYIITNNANNRITFTVEKGKQYAFYTQKQYFALIYNIQIEVGSSYTQYEPYIEPTIYDVPTNGIVEGVTSLYPSTTLYTDTSGAVIDCTYYQDGRKVKENLTDMILSLGGVINE